MKVKVEKWEGFVHGWCAEGHEVVARVVVEGETVGEGILRMTPDVPEVSCSVCGQLVKIVSTRKRRDRRLERVETQEHELRGIEGLKFFTRYERRYISRILVVLNGFYIADEGFTGGRAIMRRGLSLLFDERSVQFVLGHFTFPDEKTEPKATRRGSVSREGSGADGTRRSR